jgi:hypothetical protein
MRSYWRHAKHLVVNDPMLIDSGSRQLAVCPGERFARLRDEFGSALEAIEIDEKHANPFGPKPAHSMLTNHLI